MLLSLLQSVSFSHLKNEKLKGALTVLGMALGIAVYAGIRFASENVFQSFETSTQILAGSSGQIVLSKSGRIDEKDIPALYGIEGVRALIPLSQRYVRSARGYSEDRSVKVVGLDMLRAGESGIFPRREETGDRGAFIQLLQPGSASVFSSKLSQESADGILKIISGTDVKILRRVLTLPKEGLSQTFGGRTVLMDIAAYQELFDDYGKVDRLLVGTDSRFSPENFSKLLSAASDNRLVLSQAEDQSREGRKMTEAFYLNLQFLACVSLLVAVLLIYNSVSYAVLKRRREIGTLLALGVKPKTLFLQILVESVAVGLAAACLGTLLGYLLSFINVRLMTSSISGLYFPVEVATVRFEVRVLIECLVLGPALAVVGCLLPCLEIFSVPPRETFHYQNFEEKFKKWLRPLTGGGFIMLAFGLLFARSELLEASLWLGFISPACVILGFVLLVPSFLSFLIKVGKIFFKRTGGLASFLALDHIQSTLQRNAVAVASVMIALGMFFAMSAMILSFRGTVERWIHHVTQADLFISTPYPISGYEIGYLPASFIETLTQRPEVQSYDWITSKLVPFEGRQVKINGIRFEILSAYNRLMLQSGRKLDALARELERPDAVLISETFANRFGFKIGSQVTLVGNSKTRTFTVADVFYDYSSDQGVILMDDAVFADLYEESRRQGMALYLKNPEQTEAFQAWVETSFASDMLTVRSNLALRREVMGVFDQTFRITRALQWIALLIAAFTVLNTILMLTLERAREFSVLRALGASSKLLVSMITQEALLIGVAAIAGSAAVGLALSLLLVFVINSFFFAWSVVFEYPWSVLFSTAVGTLLLSWLAGYLPARHFVRHLDTQMLRYE